MEERSASWLNQLRGRAHPLISGGKHQKSHIRARYLDASSHAADALLALSRGYEQFRDFVAQVDTEETLSYERQKDEHLRVLANNNHMVRQHHEALLKRQETVGNASTLHPREMQRLEKSIRELANRHAASGISVIESLIRHLDTQDPENLGYIAALRIIQQEFHDAYTALECALEISQSAAFEAV